MKKKNSVKINKNKGSLIIILASSAIIILLALNFHGNIFRKDSFCMNSSSLPLTTDSFTNASDYFIKGDMAFVNHDCMLAVAEYTKALALNPKYAEAYNNRAYAYMRMQDYENALPDLDMAISLRPNYVNALMNRGDIYNYYKVDYEKALSDYNKILEVEPTPTHNNLCGHRLLALNNGWNFNVLKEMVRNGVHAGCQIDR